MLYVYTNCDYIVDANRPYRQRAQRLRSVQPKGTSHYKRITGWAVAQTCCISQCAKYMKSGIFGYPWEQNP